MAITVQATAAGYYGSLREPGDIFDIAQEQDFSERWMKKMTKKDLLAEDKAKQAEEDEGEDDGKGGKQKRVR